MGNFDRVKNLLIDYGRLFDENNKLSENLSSSDLKRIVENNAEIDKIRKEVFVTDWQSLIEELSIIWNVSVNDLPCNKEVKKTVNLLTYKKPNLYFERDNEGPSINEVKRDYYDKISESAEASIAKLFDRCHNVSSMAGTFTKQKIQEYIAETETYVLPLIKITKENHPEYQNVLFVLKYHIWSVLDAIKGTIETYSESNGE